MKKLCESSLGKIEISNGIKEITWYDKVKEGLDKSMETTGNSIAGVLVGAVSNFVGGNIGLVNGIVRYSQTHNPNSIFEGIEEVNNKLVKPVNNAIRDKIATNEDAQFAYDVGYIGGNFVPLLVSLGVGLGVTASTSGGEAILSIMGSQGALALEQEFVSASQVGQILVATVEGVSSALAIGNGGNKTSNSQDEISKAINRINENDKHHIIEGSKGKNHNWDKLVEDKNWDDIEKIIDKTLRDGKIESQNARVTNKILDIDGKTVEVRYHIDSNGNLAISDAFVRY